VFSSRPQLSGAPGKGVPVAIFTAPRFSQLIPQLLNRPRRCSGAAEQAAGFACRTQLPSSTKTVSATRFIGFNQSLGQFSIAHIRRQRGELRGKGVALANRS
jgi:hypothetical protein